MKPWLSLPALRARPGLDAGPVLAWFDARTRRERVMVLLAGVAMLWALADSLWINRSVTAIQRGRFDAHERTARLEVLEAELSTLRQEAELVEQTGRRQTDELRRRVQVAQQALQQKADTLVKAEQMPALLQALLAPAACADKSGTAACRPRLRVRSLRSLAPEPLLAAAAASTPAPSARAASAAPRPSAVEAPTGGLWKQGVEIVLEGPFRDLHDYVRRLEALPQWTSRGALSLQVEQYPLSVLTLRVYTLSLDAQWLEL